jgi:hypothetical protein
MRLPFAAILTSIICLVCQTYANAEGTTTGIIQADARTRSEAIRVGRALVQNPNSSGFRAYVDRLHSEHPDGNINELVFLVTRAAINETIEDKKYFVGKLEMYNEMGKALGNYLDELEKAANEAGGGGGKGQSEVNAEIASLRKAIGVLQAVMNRTEVAPAHEPDVAKLRSSLANDRKAIAAAEKELRRALAFSAAARSRKPGSVGIRPPPKSDPPPPKLRKVVPLPTPTGEPAPSKLQRIERP